METITRVAYIAAISILTEEFPVRFSFVIQLRFRKVNKYVFEIKTDMARKIFNFRLSY